MTIDQRWITGTVQELARVINAGRVDALPILADALMDAGCDDARMLAVLQNGNATGKTTRDALTAILNASLAGRLLRCRWPEYDQHGAHGSGGWGPRAKHKPMPRWVTVETRNVRFDGKAVIVDGQRRLKVNISDAETGEVIRLDYPD